MNQLKAHTILSARKLHQFLAWLALLALALFIISALTHPIMARTGPQTSKFYPPSMTVDAKHIDQVLLTLQALEHAPLRVGKVIPTQQGPLLQVTHNPLQARDYYPLSGDNIKKLPNYDETQARWLARYYTGEETKIQSVQFIDQFSTEYPWVNRLLPVYKIQFATEDKLTVFVHTETNALASINNNWKQSLRTVFQLFHTWAWLDNYPLLRVGIISILLLSLLSMSGGGFIMLLLIKRRKNKNKAQAWHRRMAWLLFIPLVGLLVSALYHLIQSEYGEKSVGMQLVEAIAPKTIKVDEALDLSALQGLKLNSLSFIPHQDALLLRASLAKKPQTTGQSEPTTDRSLRKARFDGQSKEQGAVIFNLSSSEDNTITDKQLVQEKAIRYLGIKDSSALSMKLITRFGPNYDFRNKRLPVWQIDTNNRHNDRLFIDPVTGILVEHTQNAQQLERLSFSLLHKWNFLVPIMGREARDGVVILFLCLFGVLGYLGIRLKKKRSKSKAIPAAKASTV